MTMMRTHSVSRVLALAAFAVATASCGNVATSSRSPVYLIIDSLTGESAPDTTQTSFINSDVQTLVTTGGVCTQANPCPTFFNDPGQVTLRTALKDLGTSSPANTPTTNNEVTITGYQVQYRRSDGHNVAGVDVPYSFNGATTGTIQANGSLTLGYQLVRAVAKQESPLAQYISNPGVLTVLADVTFYGADRVGNAVSVMGTIEINFANFGDK